MGDGSEVSGWKSLTGVFLHVFIEDRREDMICVFPAVPIYRSQPIRSLFPVICIQRPAERMLVPRSPLHRESLQCH